MIKIYNRDMQLLAMLDNAFNVGYEMPFNSLWMASFSLPVADEKNAECQPYNFVEVYDETEYIGLFRILPTETQRSRDGATITYQCEHVLATLLDDILFQYHTVGGSEIPTGDVIAYLLNKQSVTRWQLGTCAYNYEYEYTWENDNLLGALFSVPKPFLDEYMWTWNTQVYPWRLNLVQAPTGIESYIRYGVNLQGIRKQVDPSELCTRIYPLGYGEGVNQLTIAEVNGGVPYLESDTLGAYGVIAKPFVDRSIENADTLKARAQAVLEQSKHPRIAYSVDASELFALTKDSIDKFKTGSQVRVIDEELGIDIISRVVNYSKGDMFGDPSAVSLEIANKTQDIASSNADMQRRLKINETHAQGATNINVYNLAENCDPTHPAKFRVWIPQEAVRINKVLLTYENERFRANSKAIEAAPSETSGQSSITTTAAGGATVNTQGKAQIWEWSESPDTGSVMSIEGGHSHTVWIEGVAYTTDYETGHGHGLVPHYHYIDLPAHTHDMEHTHEIPSHTHEIDFGIYEGPTATSITLKVDEETVSGAGVSGTNVDLVNYLEVDEGGKIKRGQWHTIEIVPNTLSRIVANVVIQFFVNSRGGGDY